MKIHEALFAFLTANAGLAALVGTRVYRNKLPQKPTYPAIRYFQASGSEEYSHSGASNWPTPRLQFDCMAPGSTEASAVEAALRAALDGFSCPGVMGGSGGVRVDQVTVNGAIDGWDDDLEVSVTSVDVEISHER